MAKQSSFDIVSEVDLQEIDNAVNQTLKEIGTRYDLKSSNTEISLDKTAGSLTVTTNDDFTLKAVRDVLESKLVKRGVSLKALDYGKKEDAAGGRARQTASIVQGVSSEKAREIVKKIKDKKMKVQAAIEGEKIRVSGKNKDDLQEVIVFIKSEDFGIPLQFTNYR